MLRGNIRCKDMGKILLGYIQFELSKTQMQKAAIHLRNCPKCMEKYSKILQKRKIVKSKLSEFENKLRMQDEISVYIDNEGSEELNFIVDGMLKFDTQYQNELLQNEKLRQILAKTNKYVQENTCPKYSIKIIAKLKRKAKILQKIRGFFQHALRAFPGYE